MKKDQWGWVREFMSIHRSLWGAIRPNLRAVTYKWDYYYVLVHCYFDGVISENDRELMSMAETEVYADHSEDWKIEFKCIRCDFPEKISPEKGHNWMYLRFEEHPDHPILS